MPRQTPNPRPKHLVRLTAAQRRTLTALLRQPDLNPLLAARARALLRAAQGATYQEIARACGLGLRAVRELRARLATRGLEAALHSALRVTITLTPAERERVQRLARKPPDPTWVSQRARLLLAMDRGLTDRALARRFRVNASMLSELRKRFGQGGLNAALHARRQKRSLIKLTARRRARILALARTRSGERRLSYETLAREAIERGIIDSISRETVRQILRDGGLRPKTQQRRTC